MRSKSSTAAKSGKKRVFLVEDHPITREGFAQLINYQADLEVCGQADAANSALTGIEKSQPDLVIVDISLADSSGLELIKHLRARSPRLPMLVLSTHDESIYAERALRAGARGYVMKQAPTLEVMNAIRNVLRGELHLSEAMRSRLVTQHFRGATAPRGAGIEELSDRELEVFELLGRGIPTRRIASRLHVSVSTVETHRAHIKDKLKLRDAMSLVQRAVEWVNRRGT